MQTQGATVSGAGAGDKERSGVNSGVSGEQQCVPLSTDGQWLGQQTVRSGVTCDCQPCREWQSFVLGCLLSQHCSTLAKQATQTDQLDLDTRLVQDVN